MQARNAAGRIMNSSGGDLPASVAFTFAANGAHQKANRFPGWLLSSAGFLRLSCALIKFFNINRNFSSILPRIFTLTNLN